MTAWKPIFSVIGTNGADLSANWNDRLVSLTVEINSGDGDGDRFEAVLDDRTLDPSDPMGWALEVPPKGAEVELYMGYEIDGAQEMSWMGIYTIDTIFLEGHPRSMRIMGQSSRMNDIMKSPLVTQFEGMTVADVVRQVAAMGNLMPVVSQRYEGEPVRYLHQITSNWHILHELERRYGAVAKVQYNMLLFVERDTGMEEVDGNALGGNPVGQVTIWPEHLKSYSIKIDDRGDYANVVAHWRDKTTHMREEVIEPLLPGAAAENFLIGRLFNTEEEARAAALSKANALRRGMVTGTLDLAKGDPWIRAQQLLTIERMRPMIDGLYVVRQAIHTLVKDTGILTTLDINTPGDPEAGGEGASWAGQIWFGGSGAGPQVGEGPTGDN